MPKDMVEIEKVSNDYSMPESEGHYPYGTQIDLDADLIKKLGLGSLPAGTMVDITAIAVVTRKSERLDDDEVEKDMCLQIQHMKIKRKKADTSARAKQLYG